MSRVLQIRDVPDDVHSHLVAAAAAEGLSLSRFTLRELSRVAARADQVRRNLEVLTEARAGGAEPVSRMAVLAALHDVRGEGQPADDQ